MMIKIGANKNKFFVGLLVFLFLVFASIVLVVLFQQTQQPSHFEQIKGSYIGSGEVFAIKQSTQLNNQDYSIAVGNITIESDETTAALHISDHINDQNYVIEAKKDRVFYVGDSYKVTVLDIYLEGGNLFNLGGSGGSNEFVAIAVEKVN